MLPVTLNNPVMYSPVVANTATLLVPPTLTATLPPDAPMLTLLVPLVMLLALKLTMLLLILVIRPLESTVTVGILVLLPYVPAVTAVLANVVVIAV